jgi:hypothetical protein
LRLDEARTRIRVVEQPETRYPKTVDGLSIAYPVLGQGPVDLVYTEAWISNVDARWDVRGSGPSSASLLPSRA